MDVGSQGRIFLLEINGELTGLGLYIEALLERRMLHGVRNSRLITNDSGLRTSWEMLRNRFSDACDKAARKLTANGNDLAAKVVPVSRYQTEGGLGNRGH